MIAETMLGTALLLALVAAVAGVESRRRGHAGVGCASVLVALGAFWAMVGAVLTTWAGV